jgi:antitoxin (DNA-binding transcriptional repressor) of toxin-antitoxin stability system
MKSVGMKELKAHLSEYVRAAGAGAVLTVLDRDTPIATIGPPSSASPALVIRKATRRARELALPRRPALATDSLATLAGDRLRR